jgi:PST family polysaccharide transporter
MTQPRDPVQSVPTAPDQRFITESVAALDETSAGDESATLAPRATAIGRPTTKLGTALKWSYVMTTGGNLIQVTLTFVVAALLGPLEYGLMALAMVWVALALVLLQHGPTLAVIQQHDITDEHVNASFWSTLAGSVVWAGLLVVTAPLWAAVNGLPELTALCLALAPVVVLQSFNVIQDAVLRRRMQMRGIAIRVMLANVGGGVTAIGCALAGMGVWALVAQQLVWPTLYAAMLWPIAGWRPRRGPILRPLRDLRRTSLQTYSGAVGSYLSTRTDVVLMGTFFGPVIIGLWRFAQRLSEMANELTSGGLRLVSLPHLARHGEDTPALERELGRLMYGASLLTFPALGMLAGVPDAVVLFIGDQWAFAAAPLRVLCVVAATATVGTILAVTLQAKQRPGIPALFTWITIPCVVIGIVVSARVSTDGDTQGQLLALAVAMLTVQVVINGVMGYVVFRRILRVSPWPTVVVALPGLASGAGAAVAGAVTYQLVDNSLNRFFDLLVSGTAAAVAAAAVLIALDRQARSVARRLLARRRHPPAAVELNRGEDQVDS